MILEKSDFALVDRSHEDKVWKDAISKGKSSIMLKEDIAMSTKKFSNVWGNSSTKTSAKKFNKALKSSKALRSNRISSSTALTASTSSNFSFYSSQTLTSKKCHEEEFTNFFERG